MITAGASDEKNFLMVLHGFASLPFIKSSKSIFQVAGISHKENICSNVLAFYLDPRNEHGLNDLFLTSLASLAGSHGSNFSKVEVNREVWTGKGRLDLVVISDDQVIGIENKLFHHLGNDLEDYGFFIERVAREKNKSECKKIILSVKKEADQKDFICITYAAFWQRIRENLGGYVNTASQKWMLYLVDFMAAIEELYMKNDELDCNDVFFINNRENVDALIEARERFKKKLTNKLENIYSERLDHPKVTVSKMWGRQVWFNELTLSENTIVLDVHLTEDGWRLSFVARNQKGLAYLGDLFSAAPLSDLENLPERNRYVVEESPIDADTAFILLRVNHWIDRIIEADIVLQNGDGLRVA